MSKPLHAGHAAEAGVLAASLAEGGYRGAVDVLDGEVGFGVAMSDGPQWPDDLAVPGDSAAISRMTVKPHACCGHTFAAVDAVLDLRAEGLDPGRVRSIEVHTYQVAIDVAGGTEAQTPGEAKFSLGYCLGAALVLGSVGTRAFEPPHLGDPALQQFAATTVLKADPAMTATFPGRRQARVVVVDQDGRTWKAERATRRGDPDSPLSPAERRAKYDDLVIPVIGEVASGRLHEALTALPRTDRVRSLPLAPLEEAIPHV